jgi:serine protease Do
MQWRKSVVGATLIGAGVFIGLLFSAESSVTDASPVAPQVAMAQQPSVPQSVEPTVRQGMEAAQDLSRAFEWVAEQVTPSVVTIRSEKTVRRQVPELPDFFPHEFFRLPRRGTPQEEYRSQGLGSGVIVSADGYILTNNHVIEDADKIVVLIGPESDEVEAEIIGTDPWTDIAVIKVKRSGLPAIRMGDSERLRVGNWVLAIGSPFGLRLQHTVTAGIVSALNRSIGLIEPDQSYTGFEKFIQTDAAINPGNSGGALVNLNAELIGINTAISSTTGANAGIGFAIPVNMARQVMQQLIENGRVRRGYLGVQIGEVTSEFRDALGLPNRNGAFVQSVSEGTPAAEAGIKPGDVIRTINGDPIVNVPELRYRIASSGPNERITLGVWRDGRMIDISVRLQEVPEEFRGAEQPQVASTDDATSTRLGMSIRTLTPQLARQYGYENRQGVIVTQVQPNSEAAVRGLREGDLIEEIGTEPIANVAEFERKVASASPGDAILLFVRRGDTTRFVGLRIPKE